MVESPTLFERRKYRVPGSGGTLLSEKVTRLDSTIDEATVERFDGIGLRCGYLGREDQVTKEFLVRGHGHMWVGW